MGLQGCIFTFLAPLIYNYTDGNYFVLRIGLLVSTQIASSGLFKVFFMLDSNQETSFRTVLFSTFALHGLSLLSIFLVDRLTKNKKAENEVKLCSSKPTGAKSES